MAKSDLVLLKEATGDIEEFVKLADYKTIVNHQPPESFVENHPIAKGVKFIPIAKIEMMLDTIYQQWYVEILSTAVMLNSLAVTVRLFYMHPVTKEWQHVDGVGAAPIQVDKGQNASNLAAIKSDAIMKGLPAAKSSAIKDAADHLGTIFGRDLNRKEAMVFKASAGTDEAKQELANRKQQIRERLAKARAAKAAK